MTTPSVRWTRIPVFCTGETHEICWNEKGRLWLPQHPSIELAAIEATLLRKEGKLDNICLAFAGALRGSLICKEVMRTAGRHLSPHLVKKLQRMQTTHDSRKTALQGRRRQELESYPLVLEKCRTMLEASDLGHLDAPAMDPADKFTRVTRKIVRVTNAADKPGFRVGINGSSLYLELAIVPKEWVKLYREGKVLLRDYGTKHPSKVAFGVSGHSNKKQIFCIRYKRWFVDSHELELALVDLLPCNGGWHID